MGKLEKFGRNLLKKLGTAASPRRRRAATSSSTSSSSDDERERGSSSSTGASASKTKSMPDVSYIHNFMVIPPEDSEDHGPDPKPESPNSDEMSAGYATDDTVLSSLSPLEIKRSSLEYYEGSESQGYYSTAELSPREEIVPLERKLSQDQKKVPRIIVSPEPKQNNHYIKKDYPRINVSQNHQNQQNILLREKSKLSKSQNELSYVSKDEKKPLIHANLMTSPLPPERSATLSNLATAGIGEIDPIDRFLRNSIYKTKMITTVFEAKNGGFEEIYDDICHEIDRWFETKNMMAVACEMHWSAPREKRNRQLECRLKEKLLNALRENNKRLLYLRGMGRGKTPVKLAESKTMENITRDKDTDSVRGIYQRSYTRLLPYLHKETPEWHSQYWTLQDFKEDDENQQNAENQYPTTKNTNFDRSTTDNLTPDPQHFLFDFGQDDPAILAKNSLVSLNIIGLSIVGNSRNSSGSLFLS